jgi:hypothetical protein
MTTPRTPVAMVSLNVMTEERVAGCVNVLRNAIQWAHKNSRPTTDMVRYWALTTADFQVILAHLDAVRRERVDVQRRLDEQIADKHRILREYEARVATLTNERNKAVRERDYARDLYEANHG